MIDFLSEYHNDNEERMNFGLMNREFDKPLIDYIVNVCRSIEDQFIEFLGFKFIEDEKEIDMNDYIQTRKKTKKKSDTKFMYMQDSRYVELQLKFKINCKGETDLVTKKLLIPVADDNGYYTIKGKKYFLLYQLVDASTYTTRQNLTLKSLQPVPMTRVKKKEDYLDTDGNPYNAPTYVIYIFKKKVNILLLYFAKIGVAKTLEFFKVDKVMRFVESEVDKENNIYFSISSKILLEVNRHFFLKYQYVQSMVFMILDNVTNRLTFEKLENKTEWVEKLGSYSATNQYNYFDRGISTLRYFERMLDETTKEILKVDESNRRSIYATVRWMIQNYNALRKKDNLDLANKRLRCNEYIASLLTKAFSDRINRIISLGNKVTLDKVKEIFKFPGDIIMQQLYKSGLLRFDDKINDMDFFSTFKFTLKGPNALGSKNENNISIKYRGIHPSYIGRIDINVCGTSDPGSSGIITPFCKTDGLYFDGANEPEDGIYDMEKEIVSRQQEREPDSININLYESCDNISDLFDMLNGFNDVNRKMSFSETIKDPDMIYININMPNEDEI